MNLNKTLRFAKTDAEVALRMTKHVEKIDDGILVVFVHAAFGVIENRQCLMHRVDT